MASGCDRELDEWISSVAGYYTQLDDAKKNLTIDYIIACSGPSQLFHLQTKIEQLLQRDFLKFLPSELTEHLLSYLDRKSLLRCCCVSRTWNEILCSSSRIWQQACQRLGLIINKDLDNGDARYWKSFYIEMSKRLHHMVTYKSFTYKSYDRNLRRVTAVYYYKGKVATASESKIIQIWDCMNDLCLLTIRTDSSISSIKFDDSILIASSYLGHMVSWDANSGQRLSEFMRHSGTIFSFDYSQELNIIISGSADCKVKIWALSNGYLYKTLSDHNMWVLKVILSPYPAEEGSTQKDRHLLFSMDKTTIIVRLMNFVSASLTPEGLYMTNLYSILLGSCDDIGLFTPGLHFDGKFLYFPKGPLDHNDSAYLCKWDVKRKCMVSELDLEQKVKAVLGVGKKYVVLLAPFRGKTVPNFIVLDKETRKRVAVWNVPPTRATTPDCAQMSLGEKAWLDGLDGKNDQGVLLTAAVEDHSVYVLKWTSRKGTAIT